MIRITTKVCDFLDAGTDDNIWLQFRNNYDSGQGRETCQTDELVHFWENDFGRNMHQTWSGGDLGSCNGFRPIDWVAFRFKTDAWGANLHANDLTLCKVTVQFGQPGSWLQPGTAGYSFWEWNGKLSDKFCHWGDCRSDWEIMDKIA